MSRLTRHFSLQARTVAAVALVVLAGGCGTVESGDHKRVARTTPATPAPLHGEAARAAQAVTSLADALHAGDVERLCKPGAVFTGAVVAAMKEGGLSCEAALELSPELRRPPELTVTKLAIEPDLATAQVRVGRRANVPLDLVRTGGRWLVSFSDGSNPVAAFQRAMSAV